MYVCAVYTHLGMRKFDVNLPVLFNEQKRQWGLKCILINIIPAPITEQALCHIISYVYYNIIILLSL